MDVESRCSVDVLLVYLNLGCIDKYGVTCCGNESSFEIDHIRPLCSFDLTDRDHLLQAVNWKNLQILSIEENLVKSGKYIPINEAAA